jgi:hypothetical protein
MQSDKDLQAEKIYPLTLKKTARERQGKKTKTNRLYILPLVVLSVVLFFVLIMIMIKSIRPIKENGALNRIVTNRLRETGLALDEIRKTLILMSQDSNELRTALGLPKKSYSSLNLLESENEEKSEDDLAYFRALDLLQQKGMNEKYQARYDEIKKAIGEIVSEYELDMEDGPDFAFTVRQGRSSYFKISYIPLDEKIVISSFLDAKHEGKQVGDDTALFLRLNIEKLKNHYQRAAKRVSQIDTLVKEPVIQNLMVRKKVSMAGPSETEERYIFTVTRGKEILIDLGLNKENLDFTVCTQLFEDYEKFEKHLMQALKDLDTRNQSKINIDEIQMDMKSVFSATAFRDVLFSKGMNIDNENRESKEYIHRDILDRAENRIGSFAIQKRSGEIFVLDSNDVPLCTLGSLLEEPEKQKKN